MSNLEKRDSPSPKGKTAAASPFLMLGALLLIGGSLLAATSYFILNYMPLTALGLSALILAAVSFALARGQPRISPEISSMLLDSGLENTAAIIEELGIGSKALYLPSSMAGGKPRALLPISPSAQPGTAIQRLPNRLIVRYGQGTEEMGLLLNTLGSAAVDRFGLENLQGGDIEGALSSVLTGATDLADSVKAVQSGELITVEVTNPRIEHRNLKVFENIGSPLASIVASVVAEVTGRPVTINSESSRGNKLLVEIRAQTMAPMPGRI
jgi:hypothetical protein